MGTHCSSASLLAIAMMAVDSRWHITRFGVAKNHGANFVGERLLPKELDRLKNGIFPRSLARFGNPAIGKVSLEIEQIAEVGQVGLARL